MCGVSKYGARSFTHTPHPAIKNLVDYEEITICSKCAKRELGPKSQAWRDLK